MTSMSKINRGDRLVFVDPDRQHTTNVTFYGFSDLESKYGGLLKDGTAFSNIKEVKAHYNVKSLPEMEDLSADLEYGFGIYGMFKDEDGSSFTVYLYDGRWAFGTGADRFQLATRKPTHRENVETLDAALETLESLADGDWECDFGQAIKLPYDVLVGLRHTIHVGDEELMASLLSNIIERMPNV